MISEQFCKEASDYGLGFAPKYRNVFHELFLLFAFLLSVPLLPHICVLAFRVLVFFFFLPSDIYPRLLIQKRDISAVIMTIVSYPSLKKNSSLAT